MQSGLGLIIPSNLLAEDGQSQAIFTLAIVSLGLIVSLVGIRNLSKSYFNMECQKAVLNFGHKHQHSFRVPFSKLFYVSSLSYLIIILFSSNSVTVKPIGFMQTYNIAAPAAYLIPCCGLPGTYPILTIYLTDQVGLLITPIGLILCSFLPLLVGLNLQLMSLKLRLRRQNKSNNSNTHSGALSFIGSFVGLFSGCPSCAGSVFLTLTGIGTSGATNMSSFFNAEITQLALSTVSGFSLLYSLELLTKDNLSETKNCF